MDDPNCEFCRKFQATFKCLDCQQIFCAACCLHPDSDPHSTVRAVPKADDAHEFFKVCPLCKSSAVETRMWFSTDELGSPRHLAGRRTEGKSTDTSNKIPGRKVQGDSLAKAYLYGIETMRFCLNVVTGFFW